MEEKIIIKATSQKMNVSTILFGLLTLGFLILSFSMLSQGDSGTGMWFSITAVLAIITVIIFVSMSLCEIVVTDKRIYGKVGFGRRIDLPLDSVSAVAVSSVLTQGVSVSTSSGRITFFYLSNRNAISDEIRNLLVNRQSKVSFTEVVEKKSTNADELKKYKELLDINAITQDEFEAKKKELLGL